MLKLLADENIPKRLVRLLVQRGIDTIRIQDLGLRGISDQELIEKANSLGRAILTRDSDFTMPRLLLNVRNGVVYISFQPTKDEMHLLANRLARLLKQLKPVQGLLVVVKREYMEVRYPTIRQFSKALGYAQSFIS